MADTTPTPKPKASIYIEAHVYDPAADPEYLKVGCYVGSEVINVSLHNGDSSECDQPSGSDNIQIDRATFLKAVERIKNATSHYN